MKNERENHPIKAFFGEAVHRSLNERLHLQDCDDVEQYLTDLLVSFIHRDELFSIRDASGRRVESVSDMIAEGDIRLNANSFERERQVHKHIGDFLLFWSGVYPEFLKHLKSANSKDVLVNVNEQAKLSYHVVSTFEHDPYGDEAPVFRKLSAEFEVYQYGLSLVREDFEGFAA